MKICNPYNTPIEYIWLKGNLHTHTVASKCAFYPLSEVVSCYINRMLRYDFLAITDHQIITDVAAYQGVDGLVMLNGVEYKKEEYQTLGININYFKDNDPENFMNHQEIFDDVIRQGGMNIICHPHMKREDYWPVERLFGLENYSAIEIYNQNIKMNNAGRAVATDIWDKLLSGGRRVWGIASDDFHHCSRAGGGAIHVHAREKSIPAIMEAIEMGAFYSSSGILIRDISISDNRIISLSAASPRVSSTIFRFIGKNGKILKEEQPSGPESPASYTIKGDEGYVRAEAFREDGAMAWTQPFFIN